MCEYFVVDMMVLALYNIPPPGTVDKAICGLKQYCKKNLYNT
jgi:hypothetical protein